LEQPLPGEDVEEQRHGMEQHDENEPEAQRRDRAEHAQGIVERHQRHEHTHAEQPSDDGRDAHRPQLRGDRKVWRGSSPSLALLVS
jgi:hypothetical protein